MAEPAPPTKARPSTLPSLNDIVEAYEVAANGDPTVDVAAYLPDEHHPQAAEIALELLAVDLERGWQRGECPSLEGYCRRFPELLADRTLRGKLAFEHYRLLRSHGHAANPEEFAARFQVDTANWPRPDSTHVDTATAIVALNRRGAKDDLALDWKGPEVGERFLEFEIVERLGTGKFGRVYKARQSGLAGRLVVLKVTARRWCESDQLARLQHTHIVPIHSVHRHGDLLVVCMPYFGRHTLAHLLEGVGPREGLSAVGFLERLVPDPSAAGAADELSSARLRAELGRLTFEQLALRFASAIARGLAHAHARGILHRDLKPANILVTDDGQPMILDFNLAQDERGEEPGAQLIGGTLPYMAPEHLLAIDGRGQVDARSDVYALGVILFEMLTGRLPFPAGSRSDAASIDVMVEQRRGMCPSVRSLDPSVSPGVDAIVQRCLAPAREDRYQSAGELLEDLERHERDLPLRFAPNRSWRERCHKWVRRHPRLASAGTVSAVSAVVVLLMVAAIVWRGRHLEQLQARDALRNFETLQRRAVLSLSVPAKLDPFRDAALAAGREAVAIYGPNRPDWQAASAYRRLSDVDRRRLRSALSELLFLMAASEPRQRLHVAPPDPQRLAQALRDNAVAQQIGEPGWMEPLLRQRADLEEANGRQDVAARLRQQAESAPPSDGYFLARQHLLDGKLDEAFPVLQRYTRRHPDDILACYLLGMCHAVRGEHQDAEIYFTRCLTYWPDSAPAYQQRGWSRFHQARWAQSEADFTDVLRREANHIDALLNRALAREQQQKFEAAIEDYGTLIELGRDDCLIYLLRSQAYMRLGKQDEAQRDWLEGMRREPIDVAGWLKRANARFAIGDAEGALSDIDAALALDPNSERAWHNRAIVVANAFERFDEAIAALDRLLELRPESSDAFAMRGLLKARLADRDGALHDLRRALRIKPAAGTFYQAAMILATVSARSADEEAETAQKDAAAAIDLLRAAVVVEPRLAERAGSDPDLAPLANRADFQQLLLGADAVLQHSGDPAQTASSAD